MFSLFGFIDECVTDEENRIDRNVGNNMIDSTYLSWSLFSKSYQPLSFFAKANVFFLCHYISDQWDFCIHNKLDELNKLNDLNHFY